MSPYFHYIRGAPQFSEHIPYFDPRMVLREVATKSWKEWGRRETLARGDPSPRIVRSGRRSGIAWESPGQRIRSFPGFEPYQIPKECPEDGQPDGTGGGSGT